MHQYQIQQCRRRVREIKEEKEEKKRKVIKWSEKNFTQVIEMTGTFLLPESSFNAGPEWVLRPALLILITRKSWVHLSSEMIRHMYYLHRFLSSWVLLDGESILLTFNIRHVQFPERSRTNWGREIDSLRERPLPSPPTHPPVFLIQLCKIITI